MNLCENKKLDRTRNCFAISTKHSFTLGMQGSHEIYVARRSQTDFHTDGDNSKGTVHSKVLEDSIHLRKERLVCKGTQKPGRFAQENGITMHA